MKLPTISKVLEVQLKDLYSAENQLVKALPKLAKKASSASLKEAITSHLEKPNFTSTAWRAPVKIWELSSAARNAKRWKV